MTESRRSGIAIALVCLVAFTALGAIPAGIAFLADPGGGSLGMTPDLLLRGPFRDYTVPGLFLLLVLGLGGTLVAWGLWKRRSWGAAAALGYGVTLLAWITVQAWVIGVTSPLQPVFGTIGLLIAVFAAAERTRRAG